MAQRIIKFVEGFFEARPLGRDDPPYETRTKNTGGHLGKYIGVVQLDGLIVSRIGASSASRTVSPPLRVRREHRFCRNAA